MIAPSLYTFANPHFYESAQHYGISDKYVNVLKELLPSKRWSISRNGIWVHANRKGRRTPEQGFKIHVSSIPRYAVETLRQVVPECVKAGTSFKIAGDPYLLHQLNFKLIGRGNSGKFMTLYPDGEEAFKELIERLYRRTKGRDLAGPYILSDRRYKDSPILYYRYGGFRSREVLQVDGSRQLYIRSPQGEEVIDRRNPYFQLPDWVEDPFGGSREVEDHSEPVLNERYRVESVLGYSNSGGIYEAQDLKTNQAVIVKEARPYANYWWDGRNSIDAIDLLKREHRILSHLADLDSVARPVDLFREWEHAFLVEEKAPGETLKSFLSKDDIILAPYIREPGRIGRFMARFAPIALDLLKVVRQIHARGVVIADLSLRNVMYDRESGKLTMIDFESAVFREDAQYWMAFSKDWSTPGFEAPDRRKRRRLGFEDDYYALGISLFSAILPVEPLFKHQPDARPALLDELLRLGVPTALKEAVEALLDSDVEGAEKALGSLSPATSANAA